jgi:hypothetical protein
LDEPKNKELLNMEIIISAEMIEVQIFGDRTFPKTTIELVPLGDKL